MSGRTWSRAALLALALALPVAPLATSTATAGTSAAATAAKHGNDDKPGKSRHSGKDDQGKSGKSKKQQKGKNAKHGKKAKFNLGGRLTAVDVEAGTVTFRVHGGKFKALRGTELTVTVADGARVRRNDQAATLADFAAGDKVRAKGVRADGVWTAQRVQAEAPGFDDDRGDNSSDD